MKGNEIKNLVIIDGINNDVHPVKNFQDFKELYIIILYTQ